MPCHDRAQVRHAAVAAVALQGRAASGNESRGYRSYGSAMMGCCRPGSAAPTPSERLDFELPWGAKLLLLAAYVASRNKPALDRRLFDPTARSGRRRGAMASDKQVRPCCALPAPDHAVCANPLSLSPIKVVPGRVHLQRACVGQACACSRRLWTSCMTALTFGTSTH